MDSLRHDKVNDEGFLANFQGKKCHLKIPPFMWLQV
jgi:hypothetical protein